MLPEMKYILQKPVEDSADKAVSLLDRYIWVFLVIMNLLCYFLSMISKTIKYSRLKHYKYRFDFEIGYFIKSPCRACDRSKDLPECADACNILDKIHTVLSEAVSCTRRG